MKCLKLIAYSILLLSLLPKGKASAQRLMMVGIKGGINFTNLYDGNQDKAKMLLGFNSGMYARVSIADALSIQPEVYFTTKGADVTYNSLFVDGTARYNFDYIEVPILLVLHLTPVLNIHAGPCASFLVGGKVTNQSNVTLFNYEDNINTDDYNKWDASIAAGTGVDMGVLGLGVRYNYGFTTIGRQRDFLGTSNAFPDARNGVLNVYMSLTPRSSSICCKCKSVLI